jgi:hypothetical protein
VTLAPGEYCIVVSYGSLGAGGQPNAVPAAFTPRKPNDHGTFRLDVHCDPA